MRKPALALALTGVMVLSITGAQTDSPRSTAGAGDNPGPNVLIFMTDDQRAGLEVMPALRRNMVANGRRYPHAYVTTPACCPSRASIMTGRYAHNHRVRTNLQQRRLNHRSTIQFYLQRAGYRTGYIGKFLNGWPLDEGPPFFNNWAINSPDTTNGKKRYYGGRVNVNGALRRVHRYSTTFFGQQAVSFLERTENRDDSDPWLLFVAPNAPHPPLEPEKRYEDSTVPKWTGNPAAREKDRADKPKWVLSSSIGIKRGRHIRRGQYRMLKSVDDIVKDVMISLRQLDESRNTLVIFISDNGFAWGEHGLDRKSAPYKESVAVPLLLRFPRHVGAGSTDPRLVANIDLAPTVLDATGVTPESGPEMDGRSLLDSDWDRGRLLLEYNRHPYFPSPNWASTITKTSQYTEYYKNGATVSREFYDLQADHYQLKNLFGDNNLFNDPVTAPAMKLQLQQDRNCKGITCP